MYNINEDILDFCKLKGWQPIATGGGCDFMGWENDAGFLVLLSDNEDAGFSPDGLLSKCSLSAYYLPNDQEEWTYAAVMSFDNVIKAVEYMKTNKRFTLYNRALVAFVDEEYDFMGWENDQIL